ncbi:DUF6307 family protein [Fodinicola feengrottensis]|uniref:Uncharacterized protein n=1 Tax=Fodinicola feengrottensis TaxID=435914 RepID=A0ABN2HWN9_9ACTN|nr:DUF6307 family protein [Fodinicola feengrottensis]
MSRSYSERRDLVEGVLSAQKVSPGKGKSLTDVAVKVLEALDSIREDIR